MRTDIVAATSSATDCTRRPSMSRKLSRAWIAENTVTAASSATTISSCHPSSCRDSGPRSANAPPVNTTTTTTAVRLRRQDGNAPAPLPTNTDRAVTLRTRLNQDSSRWVGSRQSRRETRDACETLDRRDRRVGRRAADPAHWSASAPTTTPAPRSAACGCWCPTPRAAATTSPRGRPPRPWRTPSSPATSRCSTSPARAARSASAGWSTRPATTSWSCRWASAWSAVSTRTTRRRPFRTPRRSRSSSRSRTSWWWRRTRPTATSTS